MSAHHDVAIERTYLKIFFVLFALTVLEVGITYIPLAKWALALGLLGLAFTKAGLVAIFYMHLKMEGTLLYIVCATPIVLVAILTLGLLPDVGHRVGAKTKIDFARPGASASPAPSPAASGAHH